VIGSHDPVEPAAELLPEINERIDEIGLRYGQGKYRF
jgi:hypothetical protein